MASIDTTTRVDSKQYVQVVLFIVVISSTSWQVRSDTLRSEDALKSEILTITVTVTFNTNMNITAVVVVKSLLVQD